MARRISEKQKQDIVNDFISNKSLEEVAQKYKFTKATIIRNLKKILGESKFNEHLKISKSSVKELNNNQVDQDLLSTPLEQNFDTQNSNTFLENTFLEIAPLNLEIDNLPQKDLSSVSIKEVDLPKIVYMVVDKQIELEIKLLKDYVEWNFLSEKDLNRNTIEIFYDIKTAKRSSKKEQKVIKVPNSDVFKIAAPILRARGISRIVSSELLIAL